MNLYSYIYIYIYTDTAYIHVQHNKNISRAIWIALPRLAYARTHRRYSSAILKGPPTISPQLVLWLCYSSSLCDSHKGCLPEVLNLNAGPGCSLQQKLRDLQAEDMRMSQTSCGIFIDPCIKIQHSAASHLLKGSGIIFHNRGFLVRKHNSCVHTNVLTHTHTNTATPTSNKPHMTNENIQAIRQSVSQSIDQSTDQSINQSISQSIKSHQIKPTNQSVNHSIKATNQPTKQLIHQTNTQTPTNREDTHQKKRSRHTTNRSQQHKALKERKHISTKTNNNITQRATNLHARTYTHTHRLHTIPATENTNAYNPIINT